MYSLLATSLNFLVTSFILLLKRLCTCMFRAIYNTELTHDGVYLIVGKFYKVNLIGNNSCIILCLVLSKVGIH